MLLELHIRNFAIIDELQLELGPGLTVMTGETGAGKSILVDALGLIAGRRADAAVVRHGTDRAELTATFGLDGLAPVTDWLRERDIEARDGECIVRRVITAAGRSQAWVNGSRVAVSMLAELCDRLINIHGQQANQALLRRSEQRRALDELGGTQTALAGVAQAWTRWRDARRTLETLEGEQGALSDADVDLLAYQVAELEALGLGEEELPSLEQELRVLGAAGELMAAAESALQALADEAGGAGERLATAHRALGPAAALDQRLRDVASTVEEAQIQLAEACAALERYLSDVELDPERLRWVEQRLASIDEVARKHRVKATELRTVQARLVRRLAASRDQEGARARARDALAQASSAYREQAQALSDTRRRAADALAARAQEIIRSLGLASATFRIDVRHDASAAPTPHGLDEVSFAVSTNPGQPPGPLEKVASGGELSRIALALEVVAAGSTVVPCLVFDEVDTGVGGGVAEMVGRRLRQLGASHQVLCVTHLPQVASQAHHHLRVAKHSDGAQTTTSLQPLSANEAVDELARMLGGVRITETTREHAREMREQAQRGDAPVA